MQATRVLVALQHAAGPQSAPLTLYCVFAVYCLAEGNGMLKSLVGGPAMGSGRSTGCLGLIGNAQVLLTSYLEVLPSHQLMLGLAAHEMTTVRSRQASCSFRWCTQARPAPSNLR